MGQAWQSVLWAARAVVVVICHALVVAVIMVVVRLLEELMVALWGGGDPLIFGAVPLKYLFQFVDVVLIGVFLIFGSMELAATLRGKRGQKK